MLQAVHIIVRFYQELAVALAQRYAIDYPTALKRIMLDRLEKVGAAGSHEEDAIST